MSNTSNHNQNEISSAEGLDSIVRITKPSLWLLLIAISIASLVIIIWGLFGTIPQKVSGVGIISSKSGIDRVVSKYSGAVNHLFHIQGDQIKKGDLLLTLTQPELKHNIEELENNLKNLLLKDSILSESDLKTYHTKNQANRLNKQKTEQQISSLQKQSNFMKNRIDQQKILLEKGLITTSEFQSNQKKFEDIKSQIVSLKESIKEFELSNQEWLLSKANQKNNISSEISNIIKKLKDLKDEYEDQTNIKSPIDGVIISHSISSGDVISPNQSLFLIEKDNNIDNYMVELFIPFTANSPIETKQEVRINPFTVNKDKYGQIIGTVKSVSRYPASTEELFNQLKNQELVSALENDGPRYQIIVELDKDKTLSGFKWTSEGGPPFKVSSGTMCLGDITVENKRPLDLIIPFFKQFTE